MSIWPQNPPDPYLIDLCRTFWSIDAIGNCCCPDGLTLSITTFRECIFFHQTLHYSHNQCHRPDPLMVFNAVADWCPVRQECWLFFSTQESDMGSWKLQFKFMFWKLSLRSHTYPAKLRQWMKSYSKLTGSSEACGEHVPLKMSSDIQNILVVTANLFLSCPDSHSNSCQRAIKRKRLLPPVFTPNWAGHDTVPLAVVCGMACCQEPKEPAWQGHVTERQEHLHIAL